MAIFGGLCFALLSLMIAHANDFLAPNQMVAMSSGLLMVNSGGAIIGPPLIATVTEFVGVASFFPTMSLFLFAISGFVIYRMRIRDAVPEDSQGTFVAIPESSLGVAVTLNPEVEWVENTINKTENNPNLNKHFTN